MQQLDTVGAMIARLQQFDPSASIDVCFYSDEDIPEDELVEPTVVSEIKENPIDGMVEIICKATAYKNPPFSEEESE